MFCSSGLGLQRYIIFSFDSNLVKWQTTCLYNPHSNEIMKKINYVFKMCTNNFSATLRKLQPRLVCFMTTTVRIKSFNCLQNSTVARLKSDSKFKQFSDLFSVNAGELWNELRNYSRMKLLKEDSTIAPELKVKFCTKRN